MAPSRVANPPRTITSSIKDKVLAKKAKALKAITDREWRKIMDDFPKINDLVAKRPLKGGLHLRETLDPDKPKPLRPNGYYIRTWRGTSSIELNMSAKEFDLGRTYARGRWSVSSSTGDLVDTFRHELGHHIHLGTLDKKAFKEWDDIWNTMKARSKSRWSSEGIHQTISEYAASNEKELFAESFAMYTHPQYGKAGPRLPTLVEDFMKKHLGTRRALTGLRVAHVRITERVISVMRQRVADGEALEIVARDYGVSAQYADDVVNRRIWKDVA